MTDDKAALLPCPFCGGEATPAMAMNMHGTRYYHQCNNCNMQGPDSGTREGRDTVWNTRPALSPRTEGWVMVPREPTPTMRKAGCGPWATSDKEEAARSTYRAMIAAAPAEKKR